MKKLFLSLITLVFLSGAGFAQEVNLSQLPTGGYTSTFPVIKRSEEAVTKTEPAQIPTKLFDVRNGNGLVESGTTYTRATYIAFSSNAAKDAVIDAVCGMGGYQGTVADPNNPGQTIPNPQSKQAFFNRRLQDFLRDNYKAYKISVAEKAAKATAEAAADAELPPIQ